MKKPSMTSRGMRLLAVCCIALALAGCKDGDTLPSAFEPTSAAFITEDVGAMSADYVTIEQVSVDQGRIRLAIVVHDVAEPVSGLAMKLTYPNTFAKFVDCTDGDLFPSGDCYSAEPDDAGEVFIGRSVTGAGQAVTVSGAQTVVNLEFLVFAQGVDSIVIEGQNLGGGDASALLDANGDPIFVHWFAGALVGQ